MEIVVAHKEEFPGFRMRMLADRDEGCVIWEVQYLNEDGSEGLSEIRRFRTSELLVLDELIALLRNTTLQLTPRMRIDKVKIEPPV